MKNYILNLIVLCCLLAWMAGCEKSSVNQSEDVTLRDTTVRVGNTPPSSTFTSISSTFAKGENVALTWTGTDPENSPALQLNWYANGDQIGEGETISFTPPDTGIYNITLIAKDGSKIPDTTTNQIRVKNDLHLLVKLLSLTFNNSNIGDGFGSDTKGYLTTSALAFDYTNHKIIQQNAYPSNDPSINAYIFHPNSINTFSQNSGIVIYDGNINSSMGFALNVIDYDQHSFNWFGFFDQVFGYASTVVQTYAPDYAIIPQALDTITNIIQKNVTVQPEDNVIGNFRIQIQRGSDHWGTATNNGTLSLTDQSYGVKIVYHVEVVD